MLASGKGLNAVKEARKAHYAVQERFSEGNKSSFISNQAMLAASNEIPTQSDLFDAYTNMDVNQRKFLIRENKVIAQRTKNRNIFQSRSKSESKYAS